MTATGYPADFVCPHCQTNDWATSDEFIPVEHVPPSLLRKLVLPFLLVMTVYLLIIIGVAWMLGYLP